MSTAMATAAADDARAARLARQQQIEDEITRGNLRNERGRLDEARENLDFYRGNFDAYPPRSSGLESGDERYNRYSLICQRIIRVLTANLYASGPARELPDHPAAQEWLANAYKCNAVDALLKEADRLAAAGQAAALQVSGVVSEDGDYECEVEVQLWDASQFIVWAEPSRPTRPVAVAVLDVFDCQRRIRLWTRDELVTFLTPKLQDGQTTGATAYRFESREDNPYSILPFAFFHWNFPATDFWSGSPGTVLRKLNDYTNFFLTEHGDALRYSGHPVLKGRNLPDGWRPPTPVRPGDFWLLPPGDGDATDPGHEPDVDCLQADLGFVSAGWEDLNHYLDRGLEDNGVPRSAVRMESADISSGVQVVAEQIPLILWSQGRQPEAAHYELDLCRVALAVGAAHLRNNEITSAPSSPATVAQLEAAAKAPGLQLKWPDMFPELPGPGRDTADAWLLEQGLTSRIHLLMKRRNLSRDEAIAELKQIGVDRRIEAAALGLPAPGEGQQPQQAGASGAAGDETDPAGTTDAGEDD